MLSTARLACVALAATLLAALAVGCGNSRTPVRSLTHPLAPSGSAQPLSYPIEGIKLQVPRDWIVAHGHGALVATISSGDAVVALWRFQREVPRLVTPGLRLAVLRQLLAQARARDPQLQLIRSTVARVAGHRAIELDLLAHLNGRLRRIRSTHVFASGAEIVLDEYAPPQLFHVVDHEVFSPLTRSLRLSPPRA